MAKTYNKYQYETSPRKIEPEYVPKKNPYKTKKSTAQKTITKKYVAKKRKLSTKRQIEIINFFLLGFALLFAISYRNAKIDENFAEIQNLKEELSYVNKQNTQLEVAIESNLNLYNIEQQAKELLGMQKLSNKQTVYVTLPKTDYIESAAEQVVIEEETSLLGGIIKGITNIFK